MLVHVTQGLAITTFLFPRADRPRRRQLTRRWCRRLVQLMQVEIRVDGSALGGDTVGNICYVSNHVSWLDIFVLNAVAPAQFIAKAELARWPIVGKLIRDTATIFVERARKTDTLRVNADAVAALRGGSCLLLFPEGTTGDGRDVLRFHASLLQPVVQAQGQVQAIALRYCDADGSTAQVVEYLGATTFAQSYWRVCGARSLAVEVTVFPPLPAAGARRRQLAAETEALIRSAVVQPAAAMAPGTPCDHPVAAP